MGAIKGTDFEYCSRMNWSLFPAEIPVVSAIRNWSPARVLPLFEELTFIYLVSKSLQICGLTSPIKGTDFEYCSRTRKSLFLSETPVEV